MNHNSLIEADIPPFWNITIHQPVLVLNLLMPKFRAVFLRFILINSLVMGISSCLILVRYFTTSVSISLHLPCFGLWNALLRLLIFNKSLFCCHLHLIFLGTSNFLIAPNTHWIGGWVDLRAGLDIFEKRELTVLVC